MDLFKNKTFLNVITVLGGIASLLSLVIWAFEKFTAWKVVALAALMTFGIILISKNKHRILFWFFEEDLDPKFYKPPLLFLALGVAIFAGFFRILAYLVPPVFGFLVFFGIQIDFTDQKALEIFSAISITAAVTVSVLIFIIIIKDRSYLTFREYFFSEVLDDHMFKFLIALFLGGYGLGGLLKYIPILFHYFFS